MKPQVFEWVVTMSNGDFYVLTENQYKHYKENWKEGKIFFDTFEINPSFVSSSMRRPAEEILKKYPCERCHGGGMLFNYNEKKNMLCFICKGTGLSL